MTRMYGVVICPLPITTKAKGRTSPPESMREGREKQRNKKRKRKKKKSLRKEDIVDRVHSVLPAVQLHSRAGVSNQTGRFQAVKQLVVNMQTGL